jgi:hypothetical protein
MSIPEQALISWNLASVAIAFFAVKLDIHFEWEKNAIGASVNELLGPIINLQNGVVVLIFILLLLKHILWKI